MHTRNRAYRCQTRRCGSLSSRTVVRPMSVGIKNLCEGDRSKTSIQSTKDLKARCPSDEAANHDSTLNLMSETLVSVADKLEKVFNNPKERRPVSRPTIKRVYVIKFDEKGSKTSKQPPKSRKCQVRPEKDYKTNKMRCFQEDLIDDDRNEPISDSNLNFDQTTPNVFSNGDDRSSDELSRSPNDRTKSSNDRTDFKLSKESKFLETDDSFRNLINEVTSPPERPTTGSGRKAKFNYKVFQREKVPRKHRIPEIFNAILKEIGSMSLRNREGSERRRPPPPEKPNIKTLAEVLESEESLITAEYTIPRSMIKKEAIDRLQTLIDRVHGRSVVSDSPAIASAVSKDVDEWKEPERLPATMSYYTTVFDDPGPSNMDASSSMLSGPICRICHGRHGTLVKPCRCRGTLAYVHVECLQAWLTEKEVNFCELCNYTFRVIHVPQYKILPSIGFWYKFAASNHQKRVIMFDLTLGIALLPFLIFLTIFVGSITSNDRFECDEDEEFEENFMWHFGQATLKLATFLVILSYIAGVFVRAHHHLSAWFSWYVNKHVTIVLEDRMHSEEAD